MAAVVGKEMPFRNEKSVASLSFSWEFGGHTFKEYLDYDIGGGTMIVTSKLQFQNGFLASTNHYVQCYIVPSLGYRLFIKLCIKEFHTSKLNADMFPPTMKLNLGIPIFKEVSCSTLTDAMKHNLIAGKKFVNDDFNVAWHSKAYWFYWDNLLTSLLVYSQSCYGFKIILNFEFNHCSSNENNEARPTVENSGVACMSGATKTARKLPADGFLGDHMSGSAKKAKKLFSEEFMFSETFSDVAIQCGTKSFHAHRMIIAVKSPVLAAMLKQPLEEAKERRLVIDGFKPEAVEEFLRFIYSEKVNVKDYAKELFQLSTKYEVADLRILSENALLSKLDQTNLIDMNELGKLYNSKKLQDKCYSVFKLHRASLVKTKSDIDKFSDFILQFTSE